MNEPKPLQPIILASQSPRRSQLLRKAGIVFEAVTPSYEEPDPSDWPMDAVSYVESISYFKARSVASEYPNRLILAADTTVAVKGKLFGKPTDVQDARRILTSLFGTTHEVITGVTMYHPIGKRGLIRHAVTQASMRPMRDEELESYLTGGQWKGKAGAYGIQDHGDAFVTLIEGDFDNVVGLPVQLVLDMLAEFNIATSPMNDAQTLT